MNEKKLKSIKNLSQNIHQLAILITRSLHEKKSPLSGHKRASHHEVPLTVASNKQKKYIQQQSHKTDEHGP